MYAQGNMRMMRSFRNQDMSITQQKLKPGTVRRILAYVRPHRLHLTVFLLATCFDSVLTVGSPLLLRAIIDRGILAHDEAIVVGLAVAVAGVAILDAFLSYVVRWFSARLGQDVVYDLRTQVFSHVQRQPIAFFTRAQTGALVSRLNTDVIGAQQAITVHAVQRGGQHHQPGSSSWPRCSTCPGRSASSPWCSSRCSCCPARMVGRKLQRLTREGMQLDAAMGSMMTERFNVAGAMLVKLFGRPVRSRTCSPTGRPRSAISAW